MKENQSKMCAEVSSKTDNTKKKNPHEEHRKRMRERYSITGFSGMQDHEILEMLLFYSIPRIDTNVLAHDLINRFQTFSGVLEASEEELLSVKGVGKNTASLIKMMIPLFHEYSKSSNNATRLKDSDATSKFLRKYYTGIMNERVMVICIDSSCKVLSFETVCEGDCCSCLLNVRRLIEIALKNPLTAGVILAHNHPNGVALPSREDIDSTVELIKMLANVNVKLVDHFIIAGNEFTSMATSVNFKSIFK
ncbi:MAG: RadC family protein [Clostridia bacterium]|nr:RadC family protein [Clostridia bacterium]